MSTSLKGLFLSINILFLLCACEETVEEPVDFPAPGYLKLYIKAKNWEQDSILGAYLKVEQVELNGDRGPLAVPLPGGFEKHNMMTTLDRENLIVSQELPAGAFYDFKIVFDLLQEGEKVTICHLQPKKRDNTLTIGACAVPAHTRNHGDYLGPCTEEADSRNMGYSYLQFADGRKLVLYGPEEPYANTTAFEIFEGDTTEAVITIDIEKSLSLRAAEEEDDCYQYVFTPLAEIELLKRMGEIQGIYDERMMGGRDYQVYLYKQGEYNSREADRRNPFPNALLGATLSEAGDFEFKDLANGEYRVILAEFIRNRLVDVIDEKTAIVESNKATIVTLKND